MAKNQDDFEDEENETEEEFEEDELEENENEEYLEEGTDEELEDIISRTSASPQIPQRAMQRQTATPFLEMSEQPELESQVQNTPAAETRAETNSQDANYITNAPSYSASRDYATARGDYDEAGYPKQMQIGDNKNIRFEEPTPFIQPAPIDMPQIRQSIAKNWMNQMRTQQSTAPTEEKKYEALSDTRRTRRRIL